MRSFNVAGSCDSKLDYMVNIQDKLFQIKNLVDEGAYFTINRARQYGKTTILEALTEYLKNEYIVLSLDFQMISNAKFATEYSFSKSFINHLYLAIINSDILLERLDSSLVSEMKRTLDNNDTFALDDMFILLSRLCRTVKKPVVMIIDEVDSATNNQVFIDFLAQLRAYYLKRRKISTFQSVILASVYDVKNIKRKIRVDEDHKMNSPWNIATDFKVNLSFSKESIAGMLKEYENDYNTGMKIDEMAGLLFDYTSGYPFLVSKLCKLIDESVTGTVQFQNKASAWTKDGFLDAVKLLLSDKNTLFESLMGKLEENSDISRIIYAILFSGDKIMFNPFDSVMDMAVMFGFIKNRDGIVIIANRIFETLLYDYFLTAGNAQNSEIRRIATENKPQFIQNGRLNMDLLLKKYVEHFDSIYGDGAELFDEDEGRRRFLLYLRPIINGTGNYYIEAETRNERRMDVVVDYLGEQFIIELKIWHGNAYNERGEQQIADYLDYFNLKKGYMLSYNFNKKKEIGVKEIKLGDRILVEAMV